MKALRIDSDSFEIRTPQRYWALALWLLAALGTIYCTLGIDLFSGKVDVSQDLITPLEYYPVWILTLICFICSLSLFPPKIGYKWGLAIGSIAIIWLGSEAIRIFTIPTETTQLVFNNLYEGSPIISLNFAITRTDQLIDFSDEVVWVFLLVTLFTQGKEMIGSRGTLIILWIVIGGAFLCALSTLLPAKIWQYQSVIDYFTGKTERMPTLTGLFSNENSLALALFIGILACLLLNCYRPRAYVYLPIALFFTAMIVMTVCKTILLLLAIFLPIYWIWRCAINFRSHPIASGLMLGLLLVTSTVLLSLLLTLGKNEGNIFHAIVKAIENMVTDAKGTGGTRVILWKKSMTFYAYSPFRMIFGWGFRASEQLLLAFQQELVQANPFYSPVRTTHSGLLEITVRYGALGLLFFMLLTGILIRYVIKLARNGREDLAVGCAFVFAVMICYSADESIIPFYRSGSAILTMSVSVLPIIGFSSIVKRENRVII